jgi:hypothetical protein
MLLWGYQLPLSLFHSLHASNEVHSARLSIQLFVRRNGEAKSRSRAAARLHSSRPDQLPPALQTLCHTFHFDHNFFNLHPQWSLKYFPDWIENSDELTLEISFMD